jgi:hypothetical protein
MTVPKEGLTSLFQCEKPVAYVFDIDGIVYQEFIPQGHTISQYFYTYILCGVPRSVCGKNILRNDTPQSSVSLL